MMREAATSSRGSKESARGRLLCALAGALLLIAGGGWLSAHGAMLTDEGAPTYQYRLLDPSQGKNPVCAHVRETLNRNFTDLWNTDPIWSNTDDPRYAADSKYAFPRLAGVEHNARATFDMRLSKVPTSAEFDAIAWKEARGSSGGQATQKPVLIAYFDFDNDGVV